MTSNTDYNSNFLKYQDLTKYCIGYGVPFSFSLSTKDGTSFSFSSPGLPNLSFLSFPPPVRQTSWRNPQLFRNWEHSHPTTIKHKTPSQRRRDQRRWNDHQKKTSPFEESNQVAGSTSVAGPQHLVTDAESSGAVDGSQRPETGPQPTSTGQLQPQPPVTGSQPPGTGPQPPQTGWPKPLITGPQPTETGHKTLATEFQPPTVIKKLDRPVSMEVEAPPAIISPMSSPEKKVWNIVNLSEYSEQLSSIFNDPKNHDNSVPITTFITANNSKAAIASLNRTLKKCNLRSIEPMKVENSKDWVLPEGEFAFKFKIISKNVKTTLFNIKNNWISSQEAQLSGFFLKNFKAVLFKNS